MVNSAEQLVKYKEILAKLNKFAPKGELNWTGLTIDISYGGNKHVDIGRISVGGIASEKELGDEFFKLLVKSTEDQIKFWTNCVNRDMQELAKALGQ